MAPNMIPIDHNIPRNKPLGMKDQEPKQNATLDYLNSFKDARSSLQGIARTAGVGEETRNSLSTSTLSKRYADESGGGAKIGNMSYQDFMMARAVHSGATTTKRGLLGYKSQVAVSNAYDLTEENFSTKQREESKKAWANQIDSGIKMAEQYNALSPEAKLAVDHEMKVEKGHMDSGSFQYKRGSVGMLSTGQGLVADKEAYFKARMQNAIAQGSKIDTDVKKSGTEAEAAKIQDPEMRRKFITQAYKEQFTEKFAGFRDANSKDNDADGEYHAALWELGDAAITAASFVALPGAGVGLIAKAGFEIGKRGLVRGGAELLKQGAKATVKPVGKFVSTVTGNEAIQSGNALLQQTNAPEFLKTIGSVTAGAANSYTQDKYGNIDIRDPRSILNGQMAANINPTLITLGGRKGAIGSAAKASHQGLTIVGATMNTAGIVEGVSKVGSTIRNFDHEVDAKAQELDRLPQNKGKTQEQLRAMAKQQVIQSTTTNIGDIGFSTHDMHGTMKNKPAPTQAQVKSAQATARENMSANHPNLVMSREHLDAASAVTKESAPLRNRTQAHEATLAQAKDRVDGKAPVQNVDMRDKAQEIVDKSKMTDQELNTRSIDLEMSDREHTDEYSTIGKEQKYRQDSALLKPKDENIKEHEGEANRLVREAEKDATRKELIDNRFFGDARVKDTSKNKEVSKEKDDTRTKDDTKEDPISKEDPLVKDRVPHVAQDPNREIAPPALPPAASAGVGGGGFSSAAMSGYPSLVNPSYNTVQIQLPYFSELGL